MPVGDYSEMISATVCGRQVLGVVFLPSTNGVGAWLRVRCDKCGRTGRTRPCDPRPCRCVSRGSAPEVGRKYGLRVVVKVEVRPRKPGRRCVSGGETTATLRCICGRETRYSPSMLRRLKAPACISCWQALRHRGGIATVPRWGVVTRLFRPGLALGTIIKQRSQKDQRRRPETVV